MVLLGLSGTQYPQTGEKSTRNHKQGSGACLWKAASHVVEWFYCFISKKTRGELDVIAVFDPVGNCFETAASGHISYADYLLYDSDKQKVNESEVKKRDIGV